MCIDLKITSYSGYSSKNYTVNFLSKKKDHAHRSIQVLDLSRSRCNVAIVKVVGKYVSIKKSILMKMSLKPKFEEFLSII